MPSAGAVVTTERASRYLVELCEHFSRLSRARRRLPARSRSRHATRGPSALELVEWTVLDGIIVFKHGHVALHAYPDALELLADADTEGELHAFEFLVTAHLRRLRRCPPLVVRWLDSLA